MSTIRQLATAAFCRAAHHTHPATDPTTGDQFEECPYGPLIQGQGTPDHGAQEVLR